MNAAQVVQKSTNVEIGDRLRQERQRITTSQAAFAIKVGVSKTSQFNYEAGDRMPDAEYLAKAHELGVDVNYVVTGKRDQPASAPVSMEVLRGVVAGLLEALDSKKLKLPHATVAQLVELIYEHQMAQTTVVEGDIKHTTEKFLRLVSSR